MSSIGTFCENCINASTGHSYSNWHYCNNPNNTCEFIIIRTASDFTSKPVKINTPYWCHKAYLKNDVKLVPKLRRLQMGALNPYSVR